MHHENLEVEKELLNNNDRLQSQIDTNACENDNPIVGRKSKFLKIKRKFVSIMNTFIRKWGIFMMIVIFFEILMFSIRSRLTGVRHAQFHRIQEISTAVIFMGLGSVLVWKRLTSLTTKWSNLYREVFKLCLAIFLVSSFAIWVTYYIYVPDDSFIVDICFLCFALFIHLAIFLLLTTIFEKIVDFILPNVELDLLKSKKMHTIFCVGLALLFIIVQVSAVAIPPTIKEIDVKIKNLPPSFENFTISLITDIHIGPSVGKKRVQQIVDISNVLQPDMVTVVGDTVDGFVSYLRERTLPLKGLNAKYGKFIVTGNHEYYHSDIDYWIDFFKNELNLTVLRNDHRIVSKSSTPYEQLCIAGVDDFFTKRLFINGHTMDAEKALNSCPSNSTTILLVHQPNAAATILDETHHKIDLILAGHTHRGGMYFTFAIAHFLVKYLHGLYKHVITGTQIYVSAGINYWGPAIKMIDFCEITLIKLKADD